MIALLLAVAGGCLIGIVVGFVAFVDASYNAGYNDARHYLGRKYWEDRILAALDTDDHPAPVHPLGHPTRWSELSEFTGERDA